jgi:arabinofuranan 3-O-arabinosyltransferase
MKNFLATIQQRLGNNPADSGALPLDRPMPLPVRTALLFLLDWRTRYVACWIVALICAGYSLHYAWYDFHQPTRPDPEDRRHHWYLVSFQDSQGQWHEFLGVNTGYTSGHRAIDFGGQYLMGRMLQQGYGRELYFRERQKKVLNGAYPKDENPSPEDLDYKHLMDFTMGDDSDKSLRTEREHWILAQVGDDWNGDSAECEDGEEPDQSTQHPHIGGPLYPPINAFLNYPLAWLRPVEGYRVAQVANLALAFLAGLAVSVLARGRFWWPIAVSLVFIYPGYVGSICLGQNATLTLNILLWGWVLVARDRPALGGLVWGLLAFKPVWLLSFLLVPLLTRRWWMIATMLGTAAALCLATVPFVGIHGWVDWVHIGYDAAVLYDTDENWVWMSRDLYSIPRRFLLDFEKGADERVVYPALTRILSVSLPALALVLTAVVAWFRRKRIVHAVEGTPAAFVLLGAWLVCYHFMYYDVLLTALAVCLLFTNPRKYIEPMFAGWRRSGMARSNPDVLQYYRPGSILQVRRWLPFLTGGYGQLFVLNSMVLTLVAVLLAAQYALPLVDIGAYKGPPVDTYVLIGLWAWCGWRLLRDKQDAENAAENAPLADVTEGIQAEPPRNGAAPGEPDSELAGIRAAPL